MLIESDQPKTPPEFVEHLRGILAEQKAVASLPCCCTACGNCRRAPAQDYREPCCCPVCHHCFRHAVGGWYHLAPPLARH